MVAATLALASQILSLQGLVRSVEKSVNDDGSAAHYALNDQKLKRARLDWLSMSLDVEGLSPSHRDAVNGAAGAILNAKVHLAQFDDEPALRCLRFADQQLEGVVDALAPKVQS